MSDQEVTSADDRQDTGIGIDSYPNGAGSNQDVDDTNDIEIDNSDGSYQTSDMAQHQHISGGSAGRHGHHAEGAFGEETATENANPLNDIRDAGISKREIGSSGTRERTQGGHS